MIFPYNPYNQSISGMVLYPDEILNHFSYVFLDSLAVQFQQISHLTLPISSRMLRCTFHLFLYQKRKRVQKPVDSPNCPSSITRLSSVKNNNCSMVAETLPDFFWPVWQSSSFRGSVCDLYSTSYDRSSSLQHSLGWNL